MTMRDEELTVIARELASKLLQESETKRVFKEALNEWPDKKYLEFGKSFFRAALALVFGAFIVLVMWAQGYHK